MQEEQYNSIFSQCTQDDRHNIDVMWDWNSPRSKTEPPKQKLRKSVQNSPKLPIKKHPSNNQINGFDKLKEDLETWKNYIEIANSGCNEDLNSKESNIALDIKNLDNIFDDSMEEQLIRCSQSVEHTLQTNNNRGVINKGSNGCTETLRSQNKNPGLGKVLFKDFDKPQFVENNNLVKLEKMKDVKACTTSRLPNSIANAIADDSFDFFLETLNEEEFKSRESNSCDKNFNLNSNEQQNENARQQCTLEEIERKRKEAMAKLETRKKQVSPIKSQSPVKRPLDDIEQKRLQALAKLQARKKLEMTETKPQEQIPVESDSPIKCSPDEIEQKRLQALAKLKSREKLDLIEKNRQEALKRLEMNKRKRAMQSTELTQK